MKLDVLAPQTAVEPPLEPRHDQDQAPAPVTAEAVPVAQRFEAGAEETVVPLAEPQEPLTKSGVL